MRTLLPLLILSIGCATAAPPPTAAPAQCNTGTPLLNATLWVQSSAEYKAAALQTYNTARRVVDETLSGGSGPAAVILDLDETSLDNSAFEARMIGRGIAYDAKEWGPWVGERRALAVPGVIEFLSYARSRGVTPFYVTNRKAEEEPDTRLNLEKLGFPLSATEDTLLTRGERPEWNSNDKAPRRDYVASRYRVLLLLGDDLNDFVTAFEATASQRDAAVRDNAANWGRKWLIVPNPMYGSWEQALTGGKNGCEQLQRKMDALR